MASTRSLARRFPVQAWVVKRATQLKQLATLVQRSRIAPLAPYVAVVAFLTLAAYTLWPAITVGVAVLLATYIVAQVALLAAIIAVWEILCLGYLLACHVGAWVERRRLAGLDPWLRALEEEQLALLKAKLSRTPKHLLPRLATRLQRSEGMDDAVGAFLAVACVVTEDPSPSTLAELLRSAKPLCHNIRRPRFTEAAAKANASAVPLIITALLAAANMAQHSILQQQLLFQAALPHTAAVANWSLVAKLPLMDQRGFPLRQVQLRGSEILLTVAVDAAVPRHAIPDDLRHAAPPAEQLLCVILEAAAAHSLAALQYAARAKAPSTPAGAAEAWQALCNQTWQLTAACLEGANRLQQQLSNFQLPPSSAKHVAATLQQLVEPLRPKNQKLLRGMAQRFVPLAYSLTWAVAASREAAACLPELTEALEHCLQLRTQAALRLAYLAALTTPWAAALQHLPPRKSLRERLALSSALLGQALEAGSLAVAPAAGSRAAQPLQHPVDMLVDSASAVMAAAALQMLAVSRASGVSNGKGSSSGAGSGLVPPAVPPAERLAAAGYLADLTWVLERAGGGSGPVSSPSAGLRAAHNALAAVAGWLEGAMMQHELSGSPEPSAVVQATVARAACGMVSAARACLAAEAKKPPSGAIPGNSSLAAAVQRRWKADSFAARMAFTGGSILAGFVSTSRIQLIATQNGGALAVAQTVEAAIQSDAAAAVLQALLEELLPPLASLLAEDASGRKALSAGGALPWEPLARSLAKRLPDWKGLPLLLDAVGDAISGRAARLAAAEAASAALLQEEAEAAAAAAAAAGSMAAPGLHRRKQHAMEAAAAAAPPGASTQQPADSNRSGVARAAETGGERAQQAESSGDGSPLAEGSTAAAASTGGASASSHDEPHTGSQAGDADKGAAAGAQAEIAVVAGDTAAGESPEGESPEEAEQAAAISSMPGADAAELAASAAVHGDSSVAPAEGGALAATQAEQQPPPEQPSADRGDLAVAAAQQ